MCFDMLSCFSFLFFFYSVADRKDNAEDQMETSIFAPDLIKLLEECILTFRVFLKKDKKKNSALMSAHGHTGSSIQQVQSSLDKVIFCSDT